MPVLCVIQGDITEMKVDAIVNAAKPSLLGGSGVDGAIHKKAGKEMLEACRLLNGCEVGGAKWTKGYNLSASYVIHTVGPRWFGGLKNEAALLSNCYKNSLHIAEKKGFKTIAFPAISTGIYRYPSEEATDIAIRTVRSYLAEHPDACIETVFFVCFDDSMKKLYETTLENLSSAKRTKEPTRYDFTSISSITEKGKREKYPKGRTLKRNDTSKP